MRFPRGVLFDLDGTLIDSLADIANCANRTLVSFGLGTHKIDRFRHFVGDGVTKLLERCCAPRKIPADLREQMTEAFKRDYREHGMESTQLYSDINHVLCEIRRAGSRTGVLSNKPDALSKQCVERFLPGMIDITLGESAEVARKPAPDGLLFLLRALGLNAGDAVYVGDSHIDVEAAHAAGLRCIGAAWGFRGREELRQAGADRIVDHPGELLSCLQEVCP